MVHQSARASRDGYRSAAWLALALACSYPLSIVVPAPWALENGAIENLQVVVLVAGAIVAAMLARSGSVRADARLAAILVPFWATLAGRELSWGAVFLPPSGFVEGVALYSSSYLWYKPLVAPVIVLAAAWMLASAWRHRLFAHAGRMLRRRPGAIVVLVIAAAAGGFSACAEGHLGCSLTLGSARAMALEEMVELIAYAALVVAQWLVLRVPPAPLPAAVIVRTS